MSTGPARASSSAGADAAGPAARSRSSRSFATGWPSGSRGTRRALSERTRSRSRTAAGSRRCCSSPRSTSGSGSPNEDIGEPGCQHWHVRPRWRPLGMLMNWWRVVVSSGCPLARPHAPTVRRRGRRREHRGLHRRPPLRARGGPRGPGRAPAGPGRVQGRLHARDPLQRRADDRAPRPGARLLEERGAVRTHAAAWTPYGGWIRLPPDVPLGYGVTRQTLDPLLRELTANTPGVELLARPDGRRPARRRRPPRRGRGREPDGRAEAIRARLVVAADGRGSTVARLAGVPGRVREHNRFTYFAYWRGIRPPATTRPGVVPRARRRGRLPERGRPDGGRRRARTARRLAEFRADPEARLPPDGRRAARRRPTSTARSGRRS